MLSLPPIALDDDDGEYELVLPGPSVEWVRLLAWQMGDRSCTELIQQLADNPVLLVYAAISFQAATARPSESLAELGDWFGDEVSDLLPQLEACSSARSNPRLDEDPVQRYVSNSKLAFLKPLKGYLRSTGRKRLQFLSQFLTKLVDFPKHRSAALVARIPLGLLNQPISRSDNLDSNRSQSCDANILGRWRDVAIDKMTVVRLRSFYQNSTELQSQFQQRLQKEKLASLHQLAYGASHEINNPLANIATRAQSLLNSEFNPDRRSKLGTIYEQAMRTHEMISDLMLFANPPEIQSQRIELRLFLFRLVRQAETKLAVSPSTAIDAVSTVHGNGHTTQNSWIESSTSARPRPTPIQLMVRIAPGIDYFQGDPSQLHVALLALIQNGIESLRCSTGNRLEIRVSKQNDSIWFEVYDDGRGVSSSIARHMFDPFFSGREAGRGLGFGLPKAWRIAQMHQGDLRFDPDHQPGARFVLEVPIGLKAKI